MNKKEKNVIRAIVFMLAFLLSWILFACQFEFKSDCQEQNDYWNTFYDQKIEDLWDTCPHQAKCDFEEEVRRIEKERSKKLQDCRY